MRETFEEAGVLLARSATTGELVDPSEPRLETLRAALNAGSLTFGDLLESEDLLLDVGGMEVFSHWITPEGNHRRYDTWFFVAAAPEGHAYAHDEGETVASTWIRPADALECVRPGRARADLPDAQEHRGARSLRARADLLDAVARATDVPPATQPQIVLHADGGHRLVLPGDPDYAGAA